jgi:hypothetical protein
MAEEHWNALTTVSSVDAFWERVPFAESHKASVNEVIHRKQMGTT